jgi:hypothetical protein
MAGHRQSRTARVVVRAGERRQGHALPGQRGRILCVILLAEDAKTDWKEITSVTMHLSAEADAEADVQEFIPSRGYKRGRGFMFDRSAR